jgi:hypothetical protein
MDRDELRHIREADNRDGMARATSVRKLSSHASVKNGGATRSAPAEIGRSTISLGPEDGTSPDEIERCEPVTHL